MFESYLKLCSKIHDYLSNSRHVCYFQMNIKHEYFCITVYRDDRYIFAFIILEIEQFQFTRMFQESASINFIMSELMNILLDFILELNSKSFLLHSDISDSSSAMFYMNDVFEDFSSFETQFAYLRDHFFFRIE